MGEFHVVFKNFIFWKLRYKLGRAVIGLIYFFYDNQKKLIGEYHLPADGSFYLFNSWLPHCFGNMGDKDRLHAVFAFTDKIFYYSKSKLILAKDLKTMMLKDLNKF